MPSYVILLVSFSIISMGVIGFLNWAHADTMGANDNMTMNANMSKSENKTLTENVGITGSTNSANPEAPSMQKMMSPLQQFKSGVSAKDVQCGGGFTVVIKTEDGSPACVRSQTAQVLVARGWGTMP